jgi:hypothetical protein
MSDTEAYQIAYGCAYDQANSNAWRLKVEEGVRARIQWIQSRAASKLTLTNTERRERLARYVRANPVTMDIESEGDLIQEVTRDPITGKVTKIKLPSKRECIESDARLAGEWMERPSGGDHSTRIQAAVINVFGRLAGEMLEKDVTPTLPATCEEVKEAECSTQSEQPKSGPVSDTGEGT